MIDQDQRAIEAQALQAGFESLARDIRTMTATLARDFVNGEIASFPLEGPGLASVTDDRGSNAVAYGVYNNTDVEVTIATEAASLVIPARFLIVAPITVNGPIRLSAEPEGLIVVQRWRFPTPQPFFAAKLQ